ncbi:MULTISPECIES: hypothetical protein [Flavobacteriaceae]|uniref:hypothetical protein n=1 Tax=Flavobacteriaceae TaxID=49546 RepID=UPI001491602E|nr:MULTISPECIES: hypothetical protein [Allomuricauda]MDC6367247.1 hypothetical protein [Muricauda sp. AC10]
MKIAGELKYFVLVILCFAIHGCGNDEGNGPLPLSACETGSNPNATFTVSFTDLEDIDHIEPLGEVQIAHNFVGHTYVFIKQEVTEVPIYAPTDMDVINVTYDGIDYQIVSRASCEVVVRFSHITNPAQSIQNLVVNNQMGLFDPYAPSLLKLSAGDLMGTTSGTAQAKSFDFGVYHGERSQNFLNNDRFHPVETFRYSTCPYDYYTSDLQNQMYALFGPKPLAQPLDCRGPRGRAGTIAGPWFDTDEVVTPYYGQTRYSPLVVATALNGTVKIIRGTETNVYRVSLGDATYADPEEVTLEHCYEVGSGGYFYFQLQADGTLRVVRETSGTCPSEFPSTGYLTYYR